VTRGVTWIDGKPTIGAPKSDAGIRDVAIPPHLVPTVRQHLQDHVGWGKDALLFSTANGEQIGRGGAFRKYRERARKAAGRDDLRFHDLRHTGAVRGCSERRNHYRAYGPTGAHDPGHGDSVPARRGRPRRCDCAAYVRDDQGRAIGLVLLSTHV
jgi:integrase